MEEKYYSLGRFSQNFLSCDTESFNKILKWRSENGSLSFSFIVPNSDMILKTINKIKEGCQGWNIVSEDVHEYRPDYYMVMSDILEDKMFKTIYINIQKVSNKYHFI
jgi:hypothetical protein